MAAMRRVAPGSPVLEPDPEFGSGGLVEPSRPRGNWANVSIDSRNRVVVGGELGLYETADLSAGRYIDVPAQPPPGADTTAPVISGVKLTPRSWAVRDGGRAETPIASKVKQGTSFRYTLSEENQSKTAEALNMKRDKLRYRMKQFGMKDDEPSSRVGHG